MASFQEEISRKKEEERRRLEKDYELGKITSNTRISGEKIADTVRSGNSDLSKSMHDLLMATMIGKDPRLAEVAKNLGNLLEQISKSSESLKASGIDSIPKTFEKLTKTLSDLPSKVSETDKSAELIPFLKEISTTIKANKPVYNPVINSKVDLSPLIKELQAIKSSVSESKVEVPDSDFSGVESAVSKVEKAINGLRFPVPNYVLPFKDSDGKAAQATLSNGSVPVAITSGSSAGTEYTEDVATPNPIVGTATMIERDDALSTVTPIEGDWIGLRGTAEGALWVQDFNSDAILADTANMDTNLSTIAGAVSGSEMQVDVVTSALPTGAATAANQQTDALTDTELRADPVPVDLGANNDVTVTGSVTANAGTNLNTSALLTTSAHDAAFGTAGSADAQVRTVQGIASMTPLLVDATGQGDVPITLDGETVTVDLGANNDVTVTSGTVTANAGTGNFNVNLQDGSGTDITSTGGAIDVNIASGSSSGTEYTEDAVAPANPAAPALSLVRDDALSGQTTTDGDIVTARGTDKGEIYVKHADTLTVDGSGVTQPVSGTVTANLSTTDNTVLDNIDSNTDYGTVTGGGTETGALRVTLANNSTGVVSVDDNGGSLTVDGTVTANLGTLNGAATSANQSTIIGHVDGIEGLLTTIDTDTGSIATDASTVAGAVSGTEMQVDVVAPLPAGTNAIGKLSANSGVDIGDVDVTSIAAGDNNIGNVDIVTLPDELSGPGSPVIDSYTTDDVNLAANTANQSVISAPGASKQIWVYGLVGTVDAAGSISIQDEDDTALSGVMPIAANGGFVMNPSGNFAMPWIKVATNKALEIDTVTCTFDGTITYAVVSV